jgi:hypothetical protein
LRLFCGENAVNKNNGSAIGKKKTLDLIAIFFLLKDCRFCEIKVIIAEMVEQPIGHLSSESINLNLFLYDYSVYDY